MTPRYLIPTPLDVAHSLFDIASSLPLDILVTFVETSVGLLLAALVGFILALSFYFFDAVERALMPYAVALKSVPIVAISPLLVVWTGNGLPGKVILAAIVSFFPLLIGFRDGLRSKPTELHQVAQVWSTAKFRTLLHIDLPLCLPYALSAFKVAAPLSLVGAIVAEFSGANLGLGHLVIVAAYRADIALLFGAILIVSFLGILLFKFSLLVEATALASMRMSRVN
ncbi:ABC transporter permease subunit [Rhodopseudomonas palustris]|uniref:ABC transporter permease n=1 Tax=Rhodopseudomonas palustris TaxID=1076 RepID=UPI0020CE6982|nr:ABC transporter permease subunit [Rhodopseudomonas palustris]